MAQLYTLEEVKSHNGLNDAETWIVIHDVVYNATNFMKDVRDLSKELAFLAHYSTSQSWLMFYFCAIESIPVGVN